MPITVSETPTGRGMDASWGNIVTALEPDIESLPEEWKVLFEGPIKLLMGSKVSLAILPDKRVWSTMELANYILTLLKYPDFVSYEPYMIAILCGKYFNMLSTSMSVNGRFLLEGPMSQQYTKQVSEFVGVGNLERERSEYRERR